MISVFNLSKGGSVLGDDRLLSSPADGGTHVFEHIPSAGSSERDFKSLVGQKAELQMGPFHENPFPLSAMEHGMKSLANYPSKPGLH